MSAFDLDGYISNYSGHTKIARLLFIAEKQPEIAADAARLAIDELKKTKDTQRYREVTQKYASILPPDHQYDDAWASSVDQAANKELEKLEVELSSYKTNLIKESIRMGNTELGEFYYDRGDLQNSVKCHIRSKDYCTASKHILAMCLSVITVSIEMENYPLVNQYVAKAEQVPDADQSTKAKLSAAAALTALDSKKYKAAAKKFIETHIELGNSFNNVISSNDIALYGALCALATYDRSELKKCMDDTNFKLFLELVPSVRELLTDFYESRYTACLDGLEKLKTELRLDIHLHDHLEVLYEKIRSKALTQYASPFTSVNMHRMAEVFNTNIESLEKEVAALIMENKIQARIDSHNKILYARQVDERSVTFNKAMTVGDQFVRDTQVNLLKMNLIKNDFVVRPPRSKQMQTK